MIPASGLFDQSTLTLLREYDPVVQRYQAFFALFDWSLLPERDRRRLWPGPCPHPLSAYVKALLIKLCEQKSYITQVRRFLVEHPLLVLELGFRPVLDPCLPYGFDVERTVPCERLPAPYPTDARSPTAARPLACPGPGAPERNPWLGRNHRGGCQAYLRLGEREQSPRVHARPFLQGPPTPG